MTESYQTPEYNDDEQSSEAALPQINLESLRQAAREIEAERDEIEPILSKKGIDPRTDHRFTYLLGRLSTYHEQIIALEAQQLDKQFEE